MSYHTPDRIATEVNVDTRVRAMGAKLELIVRGTTHLGTSATLDKNKELMAIRERMLACGVQEGDIRIQSVKFRSGEGWLSGSTADISLEIGNVPIDRVAEAVGHLSSVKGAELEEVLWDFGDLSPHRDELLRRAVVDSKRQAELIAQTAGVPLVAIYSLTQKWGEPEQSAFHEERTRGVAFRMSKSAGPAQDEVDGYRLLQNQEGRLWLQLKTEYRIGEFIRP